MKNIAVEKARVRVARAAAALERISNSSGFETFSEAWTDFLLAANSIFSIIEKGAANDAKSRQWYGCKKKQGRQDPLVRYMVQARNADEHGIEPVAEHVPGHVAFGKGGESVHIEKLSIRNGELVNAEIHPVNGRLPTVEIQNPHPRLMPVIDDRYGIQQFDLPTEHLGSKIADVSPRTLARLMMDYVTDLVNEAEGYIR
ncbi:hypothetical protein LB542_29570 [Mesorhizobium sp. BR1-1-9]|uniref:hypothetical protein n=1 Tax=Mesorhizobium sp. BR1-1-9 TaxID=2876646 RepID=UPI001CD0E418|nr:hypothetical protein [Mesorhizobium sp. BR1-1-9]MBZ9874985.1 hypothetical protein [Mesorhizobium sp. BR1-1-9]